MTKIDDRAVPLDPDILESILNRVKDVNKLWDLQTSSLTYLDFPDSFPVRGMNGNLLGHLIWDEAETWQFQPVTHDAVDLDERERRKKKLPNFGADGQF